MEERTYISGISDLIDSVGKCKCYDDARNLLNSFVTENVGKQYEIEEGTTYCNSINPKDIKREMLVTIEKTLCHWELIDDASEETLNEAIKYHNLRGGGAIKGNFVDLRVIMKVARQYVEAWKKEAAPIIKEEKTPRLRPTEAGKKYAPLMYKHLQDIAYMDANEQSWNYLCGLTDETKDFKPIRWLTTNFRLKVLIDNFLTKEAYFNVETGAIKGTLYNSLADDEGNKIKQKSIEVAITNKQGDERRKSGEPRNPKTDEAIKNAWMKMKVNGMI